MAGRSDKSSSLQADPYLSRVVLLACVMDASELNYESMSKNDRKRIRAVTDELMDAGHLSWSNLDTADRDRGLFTLHVIRQVIEFPS